MSKGNRSSSDRNKIAGLVSVLEERKTRLMEEGSSKVKKEPAWEKEYDSLILGDGPKGTYSMDPEVSQVNNNVLVIAGTGGGKTKSVVEANLLHAFHQSMVVLLTKRRLLDQYAPLLKSRGYDVKVLDLVHPVSVRLHLGKRTLLGEQCCRSLRSIYQTRQAVVLGLGPYGQSPQTHPENRLPPGPG